MPTLRHESRSGAFQSYAVALDDRRFLMVRGGDASQQGEMVLAENWIQELKAKAPK